MILILFVVVAAQWIANRGLLTGASPPVGGATLDGAPFNLSAFYGQPAVIYFWASWCPVCKSMQGSVSAIARDHQVISLAMQSGDASAVRKYLAEADFHPMTLVDEDGAVARQFGLRGVPAIFILAPDGNIRFATAGFTSEWGLRLRLWLAEF